MPKQFDKYSVQSKLDPAYKLIHSQDLEANSFYVEGGRDYALNTVFQVRTRNATEAQDHRIKTPPETSHPDFLMWQYNSTPEALKVFAEDFDFAVLRQGFGDYRAKVFDEKDCDRRKQRMLIKAKNDRLLQRLMDIDFAALSTRNTIVPGFGKADLVSEYKRRYG